MQAMHQGSAHRPSVPLGELTEIYLNGKAAGRIRCDPGLIPAPGQYLLARAVHDSDAPLATPVFSAGLCPGGFTPARPLPLNWFPGARLHVRGPLGKGFQLHPTARFVALVAFSENPARLLALTEPALAQNAAIVLLTDNPPEGLPAAIEISPLSALAETMRWADTLAFDAPKAALPALLRLVAATTYSGDAQVFVETAIPCGGMGECGVCAVNLRKGYKLACKDGPVFDLKTSLE